MSETAPRRLPRVVSCLIKGPLGCLAFVVGAAIALVLLVPPVVGRVVDRSLEDWFAQHYAGELELGDAWLGSLYGEQRIERLILRDPEGEEVLRATLRAPELLPVFDGPIHRLGPVELRIERLRILEAEDGTTNLARALAELPRDAGELRRRSGLSPDLDFEFDLDVRVLRLRYSLGNGPEAQLENLALTGKLAWGRDATHLVLEGGPAEGDGAPLHARLELERPELGLDTPWKSTLLLERAPTGLARSLCAALRPLAPLLGASLDKVQWRTDDDQVSLLCADEGVSLELAGQEVDGVVLGTSEAPLTVTLPCASPSARAWLPRLFPLLERYDCQQAGAAHALHLFGFRWPLDGDWGRLEGELELVLAPGSETLSSALPVRRLRPSLAEVPAIFSVKEGLLDYGNNRLALEDGWIDLAGTFELARAAGELAVTIEQGGQVLGPIRIPSGPGPRAPGVPDPPTMPEGEAIPSPPEHQR